MGHKQTRKQTQNRHFKGGNRIRDSCKLGRKIEKLCANKNISVREFADTINASENDIEKIYLGKAMMNYDTIHKIAEMLETTVSELLTLENNDFIEDEIRNEFKEDCFV